MDLYISTQDLLHAAIEQYDILNTRNNTLISCEGRFVYKNIPNCKRYTHYYKPLNVKTIRAVFNAASDVMDLSIYKIGCTQ